MRDLYIAVEKSYIMQHKLRKTHFIPKKGAQIKAGVHHPIACQGRGAWKQLG
jgi:hypothetical protein